MVTKLVSMPPSQRWLTYGMSARVASSAMGSWACFLVPTNRIVSPRGDGLAHEVESAIEALDGLGQVDDVDPVALGKDVAAHLGIPAPRLMAEVDTGLQQLAHGYGGHGDGTSCFGCSSACVCSATRALRWPEAPLRGAVTRV